MFFDQFKSATPFLRHSLTLLVEADTGASEAEREQLHEKIAVRKARRIPVGKFILLLAAIILTMVVLEYFI